MGTWRKTNRAQPFWRTTARRWRLVGYTRSKTTVCRGCWGPTETAVLVGRGHTRNHSPRDELRRNFGGTRAGQLHPTALGATSRQNLNSTGGAAAGHGGASPARSAIPGPGAKGVAMGAKIPPGLEEWLSRPQGGARQVSPLGRKRT